MARRGPATVRTAPRPADVRNGALVRPAGWTGGPYDGDGPGADHAAGPTVDFGAIRLPRPACGEVTLEAGGGGVTQAVHLALPGGRLSFSALAAPTSSRLWPELATEIEASLREGGARVRSFPGDWGRELHATTGSATSVFIGVDGPRWMLYGVATGPTSAAAALDGELRRMLRGIVVLRGRSPYPVRTVLPLTPPGPPDPDPAPAPAPTPTPAPPTVPAAPAPPDRAEVVDTVPIRPVPIRPVPMNIVPIDTVPIDTVPIRSVPVPDGAAPRPRRGRHAVPGPDDPAPGPRVDAPARRTVRAGRHRRPD